MDDFSFNTNFLGRDGFTWWIGQIAPYQDADGNPLNSMIDSDKSWGAPRYKVRIMGYHPYTTAELGDENLPWALVMRPPGTGTGSGGMSKTIHFNQGDTVIGFFLDNENAQQPIIMGAIGNSKYAAKNGDVLPFGNFTGYTEDMAKPSKKVRSQSESSDIQEQPSPQSNTPERTENSDNPARVSSADGITITNPCGGNDSPKDAKGSQQLSDIKNAVEQFSDSVKRLKADFDEGSEFVKDWIKQEIKVRTKQVVDLSSGLVNGMISDFAEQVIPLMKKGLEMLYKKVFGLVLAATGSYPIARAAGLAAQQVMAVPIKFLQDQLPCIVNTILGRIGDTVESVLNSIVDNVDNFVQCVADQTIGVLANDVIGQAADGLSAALGGLDKIMQFINSFSSPGEFVENLMRNTIGGLLGLIGVAGCNDEKEKDAMGPCKSILGVGPAFNEPSSLRQIIDNANVANVATNIANVAGLDLEGVTDVAEGVRSVVGSFDIFNPDSKKPGFASELGGCYTGPPQICKPPIVIIFGGGGNSAAAVPLFGFPDFGAKTASVIDIQITNPGNGYTYPPFVQIVDSCNQGYGAVARATVKDGRVDKIYLSSVGENYPVDDVLPLSVGRVDIINPGSGYEEGDIISDNLGNIYSADIVGGLITKVIPRTAIETTELPRITVTSVNGSGAILIPKLGLRGQGPVEEVIDCISTDDIIGYVNGQPYYGPVHIHMGRLMTGETHTESSQYITEQRKQIKGFVGGRPYTGPAHIDSRGRLMTGLAPSPGSQFLYESKSESERLSEAPPSNNFKPVYTGDQVGYVDGKPYKGEFHVDPATGDKITGEPDSEGGKVIDDDQVGFVNGEPFYGDFHYHNGYPMTGEYHSGSGEYIHRTSSSSINNQYPERNWVYYPREYYRRYTYKRRPTRYIQPDPLQRTPGPYRPPTNPPIIQTHSFEGIDGNFLGPAPQFVPGVDGYDPLPTEGGGSDDGTDGLNSYNDSSLPPGVTCGLSACVDSNGNLWPPYDPANEPDFGPDPGANGDDFEEDDTYDDSESFDDTESFEEFDYSDYDDPYADFDDGGSDDDDLPMYGGGGDFGYPP